MEIITGGYTFSRDFVKLLTRLAGVRLLMLEMPLGQVNALEGLSCSFENLKDLSLYTDLCKLPTVLSILCLLRNVPNLENLFFEIWWGYLQEDEVGVDLLNAQWIGGSFGNLKTVTMDPATCQANEMHFIEFILSKAPRLEEFHVCVYARFSKSNEEFLEETTRYRKASPQTQLLFSSE